MKITTALFDMDGTLTDSLPLIKNTFGEVIDEMALDCDSESILEWVGIPLKEIAKHFCGDKYEIFLKTYGKYYRKNHDLNMPLFPGTEAMIKKIKASGFRLGIVTSKGRRGTEMTVDLLKLNEVMETIITADDVEKHKPYPEPVLLALKNLDEKPENAVFVGDSPFDIQAGQRAGVVTIGVSWGMADRDKLAIDKPTFIADNCQELTDIILSLK